MSKQSLPEKPELGTNWEEAVTRFLEQTPDYFLRHPELLAALAVPHPETGRAVSLVERQVRVLRDRNESMARELKDLLAIARDNDQLGERVQRFALAMIDSASLDEVLDTAQDMLRQEFGLEGVAVRLAGQPRPATVRDGGSAESANAPSLARGPRLGPIGENAGAVFPPHPRPEFVDAHDAALDELLTRLAERNHQPLCGPAPEAAILAALFGAHAADIRSTAVVALLRRGLRGALVLGSRDPQRFRADMGTLYLARLGELLMAGIARYLTVAS
jgi:uncharacterized protein YigA (DUF484 family)